MATKKIEINVTAGSDAEIAQKEKALATLAGKLTGKELDRLRQIVLYEPSTMAVARKYLQM